MHHTVDDVMTTQVVSAQPSTPFRELVRLLEQHRVSALPVLDGAGHVLGVVSEADLLVKEGYPHGAADAGIVEGLRHPRRLAKGRGTVAGDVMSHPACTVRSGTTVAETARQLVREGRKRLPVVDEQGRLAGIVTRGDLLKVFLRADSAIHWDVTRALLEGCRGIDAHDLEVSADGGVVTLSGEVPRASQAQALAQLALAVEGVVDVRSKLRWRLDDRTPTGGYPYPMP